MDADKPIFSVLEAIGSRYPTKYLIHWDPSRLKTDWLYATKFLLEHLYARGRADKLSERYYAKMTLWLDGIFRDDAAGVLERLWAENQIPQHPGFRGFDANRSDLWGSFTWQMGNSHDRKLVLDVLRYVYQVPGHNVVVKSLDEICTGNLRTHRRDLDGIYCCGEKTSAFYLRDLVFLYGPHVERADWPEVQPVDTWVRKVVRSLVKGDAADPVKLFCEHADSCRSAALMNVGTWMVGIESLDILLSILATGDIKPQTLEQLQWGSIDG